MLLRNLPLLSVTVLWFVGPVECIDNVTAEEILEQLFSEENYNRNIRPNTNEGRNSEVSVGLYVESMSDINELKMEYTIGIYFRLSWYDPRLRYNHSMEYLTVDAFRKTKIWLPDMYFMNSKDEHFHTVTVPNVMLRIYPDGRIMYSQRLSLTLECNMALEKFPMDTQVCDIRIMSYAFSTRDIVLNWMDVAMNDAVELPEFEVSSIIQTEDCTQVYVTGTFSCLVGKFTLRRRLSHYMLQTYVPSILIVALSWVNFWLDAQATPARVTLGLLCVLTMTTQNSGILSTLPRVSYIKSIDVWSSACLVFVFGALVEYAVVNVQSRRMDSLEKTFSAMTQLPLSIVTVGGSNLDKDVEDPKKTCKCGRQILTAERIDFISRILFPLSFVVFNIIYWNQHLRDYAYSSKE